MSKECYTCHIEKPLTEYFKDIQTSSKVKNHCKDCIKIKRKEFKSKIEVLEILVCKVCKIEKSNLEFDVDNTIKRGRKSTCKICIANIQKQYSQTWDACIRRKVVASWKAHNNKDKINKISIEDAKKLLESQKYTCAHCKHDLSCLTGDLLNKNVWSASLDRIDISIVGYGNGNAQWLCMSCNNGKNTMPNEEHLEKFKKRDDKIKELELKIQELEAKLAICSCNKDL